MKTISLNSDLTPNLDVLDGRLGPNTHVVLDGSFICETPIVLPPGCVIEGSRAMITAHPADDFAGPYFSVFHTPWEYFADGGRISGIHFDLRPIPDRGLAMGAVNLYGSGIEIRDCHAIAGGWSQERESFIFSINPHYHGMNPKYGSDHNRIVDCSVQVVHAAKTAVTAFLVGSAVGKHGVGRNWAFNSSIENCRVTGMVGDHTDPNQQIHAFSLSGCRNGRIVNCIAKDVAFGFYVDTGSTDTLHIDRLTALNVLAGCYWNLGVKDQIGGRAPLGQVNIRDPYVTLHQTSPRRIAGVLVHAADALPLVADQVILDGGCIGWDRHQEPPMARRNAFGALLYKTRHAVLRDTRFWLPSGTTGNPVVGIQGVDNAECSGLGEQTVYDYTAQKWIGE